MHLIERYWTGVQRRLQAEVEGFNSLIGHQGEKGRENELSLARVLASLVPTRCGVGSGLIFDSAGGQSSQTDIVLFDAVDEPAILAQTNQVLFPVENVRGTIEVKTFVGKDEIEDIGDKVRSLRDLQPQQSWGLPIYSAVGYRATQQPETIAKHLKALNTGGVDNRPDLLLLLDPAIVGISSTVVTRLGLALPSGADYVLGVAALQTRDSSGHALANQYEPVPLDDAKQAIVNGTTFGIFTAPGQGEYLAESARALLLFSEALVTALAVGDGRKAPGFHHYITAAMRDVIPL